MRSWSNMQCSYVTANARHALQGSEFTPQHGRISPSGKAAAMISREQGFTGCQMVINASGGKWLRAGDFHYSFTNVGWSWSGRYLAALSRPGHDDIGHVGLYASRSSTFDVCVFDTSTASWLPQVQVHALGTTNDGRDAAADSPLGALIWTATELLKFSPCETLVAAAVCGGQGLPTQIHSLLLVGVHTPYSSGIVSEHWLQFTWLRGPSLQLLDRVTGALSRTKLDVHGPLLSTTRQLKVDWVPTACTGRHSVTITDAMDSIFLLQARAGQHMGTAELTISVHGLDSCQRSSIAVSVDVPGVTPSDVFIHCRIAASRYAVAAHCGSTRPQTHVFELELSSMVVGRLLYSVQGCEGGFHFSLCGCFVACDIENAACVLDARTGACLHRLLPQDYCPSMSAAQADWVIPACVMWAGPRCSQLHIVASMRLPLDERPRVQLSVMDFSRAEASCSEASTPAVSRKPCRV